MSNSYPKLLEDSLELLDSPQGFSPKAVARRIFEALIEQEPSITDAKAFRYSELGVFAQRGLHEKVRKDARNQSLPDSRQPRLFPTLDLRYTVPHADGGERQVEHAHMTRTEWLLAESLLRNKAIETQRKADALEQCRWSLDSIWAEHPELTATEAFLRVAAKEAAAPVRPKSDSHPWEGPQ